MRKDSLDCSICAAGKEYDNKEQHTEAAVDRHIEEVVARYLAGTPKKDEVPRGELDCEPGRRVYGLVESPESPSKHTVSGGFYRASTTCCIHQRQQILLNRALLGAENRKCEGQAGMVALA
jgi:hypothetical protein